MALNPIIKFSTLFGLLAVEIAVEIKARRPRTSDGIDYTPIVGVVMLVDRAGVRVAVVLRDADSAEGRTGQGPLRGRILPQRRQGPRRAGFFLRLGVFAGYD